jgi:hypothetical protein
VASLAHDLARSEYLPTDPPHVSVGDMVQLSAPVFGADGNVELTIGVTFVAPWDDTEPLRDVPRPLLAATMKVTRAIGGRAPLPVCPSP